MNVRLCFRRVTGEQAEAGAWVDDVEFPAGEFLVARRVRLDDGAELRQHRVANGRRRGPDYDRLDGEILAGRLLHEVAGRTGYPPEVARLFGDDAESADPYTLFEPYRGQPVSEVGTYLLADEQDAFQVSLVSGLCWLAAAGIAHRALSPDTVLWDSQRRQVQITDFSLSTVFGAPREAVAVAPQWAAREQRPDGVGGKVTERDDIWAAGRLIFFVRNQGEELADRDQLARSGLADLLAGVFEPPECRPMARELIARMGQRSPVPRGAGVSAWLREGHARFWEARQRKHPGAAVLPEAARCAGGPGSPVPPATENASFPTRADAAVLTVVDGTAAATAPGTARPRLPRWGRGSG